MIIKVQHCGPNIWSIQRKLNAIGFREMEQFPNQ
jgi:hypothetical protein